MIRIPDRLLTSIRDAAEAAFPMECCGLLVGLGEDSGEFEVTGVEASPNCSEADRRKSFLVDAKIQFDLMRRVQGTPEDIIGNYHSHPGASAEPSEHDRKSVFYPDHVWVIVAVADGQAGDVAAYVFDRDDNQFREIGLAVSGGPSELDDRGATP